MTSLSISHKWNMTAKFDSISFTIFSMEVFSYKNNGGHLLDVDAEDPCAPSSCRLFTALLLTSAPLSQDTLLPDALFTDPVLLLALLAGRLSASAEIVQQSTVANRTERNF